MDAPDAAGSIDVRASPGRAVVDLAPHQPDGEARRVAETERLLAEVRRLVREPRRQRALSRRRQNPSDPAGTENEVIVICPAPWVPTRTPNCL